MTTPLPVLMRRRYSKPEVRSTPDPLRDADLETHAAPHAPNPQPVSQEDQSALLMRYLDLGVIDATWAGEAFIGAVPSYRDVRCDAQEDCEEHSIQQGWAGYACHDCPNNCAKVLQPSAESPAHERAPKRYRPCPVEGCGNMRLRQSRTCLRCASRTRGGARVAIQCERGGCSVAWIVRSSEASRRRFCSRACYAAARRR